MYNTSYEKLVIEKQEIYEEKRVETVPVGPKVAHSSANNFCHLPNFATSWQKDAFGNRQI